MCVCLCGMCMWKLISDFYITSKRFFECLGFSFWLPRITITI